MDNPLQSFGCLGAGGWRWGPGSHFSTIVIWGRVPAIPRRPLFQSFLKATASLSRLSRRPAPPAAGRLWRRARSAGQGGLGGAAASLRDHEVVAAGAGLRPRVVWFLFYVQYFICANILLFIFYRILF